jgi:NAD(P) transhydrogenase
VERFTGAARFVARDVVEVVPKERTGGAPRRLHGRFVLVATGSRPTQPPEFPFEHPRVFDSDEILQLARLPKSLAVIGAGVIGSEYASTFNALGTQVHLVDGRDALLPFLDGELSRRLAAAMAALGVRFHWKERVKSCKAPARGPST